MTIATTDSRVTHSGNGATTSWPFTFKIPTGGMVIELYTEATGVLTTVSSNFSVTGYDDPNGGSVTYPVTGSPLAAGTTITIRRDLDYVQNTELTNQDGFYPEVIETALDYLTMLTQQLLDATERAIVANPASGVIDVEGAEITNVGEPMSGSSAARRSDLDDLVIASGNVPSPTLGQVGNWLKATATGVWSWTAMTVSAISDASTLGKSLLQASTTAAARTLLEIPVSGAVNEVLTGTIHAFSAPSVPTGYLECNGAAVSRATYADLFALYVTTPGFTSQTFTVTVASPAVVTKTAHGFIGGERIRLSTTGALPTGLTAGSEYIVSYINANTFNLIAVASFNSPTVPTVINTSGSQSGTHSYVRTYYGLGDGSTTFNLPDLRGEFIRGWDNGRGADPSRNFGSIQLDAFRAHTHVAETTGTTDAAGNHTHAIASADGGSFSQLVLTTDFPTSSVGNITVFDTEPAGAHSHTIDSLETTVSTVGGTETRPRGLPMIYIVKT